MHIELAYGRHGLPLDLPDDWPVTVVAPHYVPALPDAAAALTAALRAPRQSQPLAERVRPGDRVGIVFSDITRATPHHLILPAVLAELQHIPREDITLFNALGTHRPNTAAELRGMIGGLLAGINYLYLFIIDAILSTITAILVYFLLPETKPETVMDAHRENEPSLLETIKGYGIVFKDRIYVAFILISSLMVLVYAQMNSTLSVFLRDYRATPPQYFGYILSMNAFMVVVMQFWISRKLDAKRPFMVMAAGTILYAIGFAMYGFTYKFWLFLVAMFIITIGEMMTVPTSQALVASFAPSDMRGRYMATYGLCWIIPSAVGPLLAGLVMDNLDPNWIWWGSGILAIIAALGFYWMHGKTVDKLVVSIVDETAQ